MFRENGGGETWPVEALGDEIAQLWAHVSSAMCRWLGLLAEFDRRQGWAADGFHTCAEWVAWRCSIAPVTAREYVRVAHRLQALPRIRAEFARGRLSYSKVRAISRVEDQADDELLLTYAQHATAAQLVRIVAAYRGVTRSEARRAQEERFLDVRADEDGTFVVRGRLCAEDGALLAAALERLTEPPDPTDASAGHEVDPVGARRADALVRLAERALAQPEQPADGSGPSPYEVVVHVDVAALVAEPATSDASVAPARCEITPGIAVARETARRLSCDAALVGMAERDGEVLDVGRRTRAIPPAIRRALRSRSNRCAFPGCERTQRLDAHHVHHWADGGTTSLDNLVSLCRRHHRLIHEGGWTIQQGPDGARVFHRPDGRAHPAQPAPCAGDGRRLARRQRHRGLHPGPDDLRPHAVDLHYDLGMTVEALLANQERPGRGTPGSDPPNAR